MRRLLAAGLLCYGPAALAFDDNLMGDIIVIQIEEGAIAMRDVCVARDPHNAAATREAMAHWTSINRAGLDELRTGRDKLLKAYQARAAAPEPKETLEQRQEDYNTLKLLLARLSGEALKDTVKGSDAGLQATCAGMRQDWMRREPEPELPGALASLHKLLAEVETSK